MKVFYKIITILLCWSLSCLNSFSQTKPDWVKNTIHIPLNNSRIGVYTGTGQSEEEAFTAARRLVLKDQSFGAGFWANVEMLPDGNFVTTGSNELKVKAIQCDFYHEEVGEQHKVYLLMQIATKPSYELEKVSVVREYAFTPSVFIPGMAQFKKGSPGKGILFIASETACVSGIIAAEAMRASYVSKINTTQSAQEKLSYKNKADACIVIRNISIAGVAAFYVWNVVDGIMAKGKKHVVVDGKDIAMSPWVTPDASGLAMRLTF